MSQAIPAGEGAGRAGVSLAEVRAEIGSLPDRIDGFEHVCGDELSCLRRSVRDVTRRLRAVETRLGPGDGPSTYTMALTAAQIVDFAEVVRSVVEHPLPAEQALALLAFKDLLVPDPAQLRRDRPGLPLAEVRVEIEMLIGRVAGAFDEDADASYVGFLLEDVGRRLHTLGSRIDVAAEPTSYTVALTAAQILDFAELARSVASAEVVDPLPDAQALALLEFIGLLPEPSAADQYAWLASRRAARAAEPVGVGSGRMGAAPSINATAGVA